MISFNGSIVHQSNLHRQISKTSLDGSAVGNKRPLDCTEDSTQTNRSKLSRTRSEVNFVSIVLFAQLQGLPDIVINGPRVKAACNLVQLASNLLQTSVIVYVDEVPVLENTHVCSSEDVDLIEDSSIKTLYNIAYLCQSGEMEISCKRLCCSGSKIEATLTLKVFCFEATRFSRRFYNALNTIFPPPCPPPNTQLEEFFAHLQPPVSTDYLSAYVADELKPTLTPFQSQNVQWMLQREGHDINQLDRTIHCCPPTVATSTPFLWEKLVLETGKVVHVNRAARIMSAKWTDELQAAFYKLKRGGILADEMGLGKTVSCLGLILLHRMKPSDPCHPKEEHFTGLNISGATLIITPAAITQQWQSEIKKHAPSLRVTVYTGIRSHNTISADELAQFDIVLTNYEVLRNEVYYARETPDRPRRHAIKYPTIRSPLVQILWWRCILDEAQMVESPVALTAEMARLIPRWNSWGVTGTPMKSNYDDLFGLYLFLDICPELPNLAHFRRLYKQPELMGLFWDLTKQTMRRNMKALLKEQVHIPVQQRSVVNVTFSNIEEQYYRNLWENCQEDGAIDQLESLGWNEPADKRSQTYAEYRSCYNRLQRWLLWLRQACVHPSIGTQAQRLESDTARSLPEVLSIMVQQAKEKMDESETSIFSAKLRRGGMHEILREWTLSLEVYLSTIPQLLEKITEITGQIEQLKSEAKKETDEESKAANTENNKEKTLQAILQKQHSWQSLLHRLYFFTAGIYHELEQEENETKYYDLAANIRRQMLSRAEERVNSSVRDMKNTRLCILDGGHMEPARQTAAQSLSTETLDQISGLSHTLNRQISCIEDWRKELITTLCSNLVDYGDEEAKGDEYEHSLVTQEKGTIFQDAYQNLLHDRNFFVNGIWAPVKKQNSNEEAQTEPETPNEDQSEEMKQLESNLSTIRKAMAPEAETSVNLRMLITKLREIVTRSHISETERSVVASEIDRLLQESIKQKKLQEELDSEYRKFSQLYNHRIEYYRSLQAISDHVMSWTSNEPAREIQKLKEQEETLSKKLIEQGSRYRYLSNLAKEEAAIQEMSCLICHSEFSNGIMTHCGHMYCQQCSAAWFTVHRKCPQCSARVDPSGWHEVSREISKTSDPESAVNLNDGVCQESGTVEELMRRVQGCTIKESLGAKMDGIIRHIKYIKESSNGKCVVFSQWKKALAFLREGLTLNEIDYVDFGGHLHGDTLERFVEDPNTNVILLHARSHSSGLTLVCAQTVFIVEPVLNESIEKQAISRVHRIGQTKETSVFWYIVKGSIEERIQAIHDSKRRRRLTHHTEDDDNVTRPPVLEKLASGGGELVSHDDLRRCFTSSEDESRV